MLKIIRYINNYENSRELKTRDDMNAFEELIDFLLSSRYESYKRAEKLLESLRKIKVSNSR